MELWNDRERQDWLQLFKEEKKQRSHYLADNKASESFCPTAFGTDRGSLLLSL